MEAPASLRLDCSLLLTVGVGAILVIAGGAGKNSLERFPASSERAQRAFDVVSTLLFVGGWAVVAWALSSGRRTRSAKQVVWASAAAVVASALLMKREEETRRPPCALYPAVFVGAWLALGLAASAHLSGPARFSGILAALCAVASTLGVLPAQRRSCVVDGPGMLLLVIAWVVLAIANAASRG